MERPLPDDVARPVRAYLAALVPGDEVSDAWHELLADVAYWHERQLLPVLRLAHQVVLQHQRVTPEVAALALVEGGIEDPEEVAVVLDTDAVTARRWTEAAIASRDGDAAATPVMAGRFSDRPSGDVPAPTVDDAPPSPAEDASSGSIRIGFDGDEPSPDRDGRGGAAASMRGIVVTVLALVALVVVVWLLAR